MKLPAFYLLDAVSKNVFEPYAAKFSAFVVSLFLDTYHQVDHATRVKMDEMLATWRTGGPHGKELFGVAVQVAIERSIWGGDGANPEAVSFSGLCANKSDIYFFALQVLLEKSAGFISNNEVSSACRA